MAAMWQDIVGIGKHVVFCLLSILSVSALMSCESENYESGDGKYSNLRADFAEAHTNHNAQFYGFMTDDGDSLAIAEPVAYKWASTPDSTYRAIVYYNQVNWICQDDLTERKNADKLQDQRTGRR